MTTSPLVKIFIVSIFIMILISLGTAFVRLFSGRDREGPGTVEALTVRVVLSIGLVLVIGVLYLLGYITPNG